MKNLWLILFITPLFAQESNRFFASNGFLTLFIVIGFIFFLFWLMAGSHDLKEDYVPLKDLNEERDELGKKLIDIIQRDFTFKKCSRCDDRSLELVRYNSELTSIEMKCQTCGKKFWCKRKPNSGSVTELINAKNSFYSFMNSHFKDEAAILTTRAPMESEIIEDYEEDESPTRHSIPRSIQDRVWRRDEGKCVQCESNMKLEFDHIIPVSKGGANTYRNIQLLCESCNRTKSNNIG